MKGRWAGGGIRNEATGNMKELTILSSFLSPRARSTHLPGHDGGKGQEVERRAALKVDTDRIVFFEHSHGARVAKDSQLEESNMLCECGRSRCFFAPLQALPTSLFFLFAAWSCIATRSHFFSVSLSPDFSRFATFPTSPAALNLPYSSFSSSSFDSTSSLPPRPPRIALNEAQSLRTCPLWDAAAMSFSHVNFHAGTGGRNGDGELRSDCIALTRTWYFYR